MFIHWIVVENTEYPFRPLHYQKKENYSIIRIISNFVVVSLIKNPQLHNINRKMRERDCFQNFTVGWADSVDTSNVGLM